MGSGALASAAVLLLPLALAGCGSSPDSVTLPFRWDHGTPLVPHEVGYRHDGGRSASLHAEPDPPDRQVKRPTSCLAYRDDAADATDRCEVVEPPRRGNVAMPWALEASWSGCPHGTWDGCPQGGRPGPYQPRVVAFNSLAAPVAWWDGTIPKGTSVVTE